MNMQQIVCGNQDAIKPNYFSMLSQNDKVKYMQLSTFFSNSNIKRKRYKKAEFLRNALYLIRVYCIRNDSDDCKRCAVCGIYWIGDDIAINTSQLSFLICKCKSSINGTLTSMGYKSYPINNENKEKMPFLKDKKNDQKQWNIRRKRI